MTKADIVSEISKNTGIEKVSVQKIVEAVMDNIQNSVSAGDNVYLRGFGSFIRRLLATSQRTPHW